MMIIAVDFDGTIVDHKYPEIGELIPGAKETIQALQENGHRVFLWTMRGHRETGRDTLQEAIDFLQRNGIDIKYINRSPAQFSTSKKQYANIYLDDSSFGAPWRSRVKNNSIAFDWREVAEVFYGDGLITKEQLDNIKETIRREW